MQKLSTILSVNFPLEATFKAPNEASILQKSSVFILNKFSISLHNVIIMNEQNKKHLHKPNAFHCALACPHHHYSISKLKQN